MVPFDHEMMTTPWDDFVTNILVGRYHAVHLVAGHDHHFGHKNQGSPELLMEKCRELGLGCDIIPKVEVGGITVSSTYIRRLVELGQIERANRFLGHPHILTGTVRHGRGHRLLPPVPHRQPHHPAPCAGAQPRRLRHPGHPGGRHRPTPPSPTWAPGPRCTTARDITVEACLLDFEGDLYGKTLRVEFFQHLRDEIRFDSLDALKAQIAADADTTRAYFAEPGLKTLILHKESVPDPGTVQAKTKSGSLALPLFFTPVPPPATPGRYHAAPMRV